jgi:glycosyltransferase involved in cell wall biosynthesis
MLEQSVKGLKVLPISGGVDLEQYSSVTAPKQSNRKLLYVGRLDREKHVYVLLEALAKLPKNFEVQLDVVGNGSQMTELKKLVSELGLDKKVHFHGELTDTEVLAKFGESSVFVMPSTQELQSMATLEAMAAGRPIIAANALALPHLVHDGDNGYLYKSDSPSDLARKIQQVFEVDEKQFLAFADASNILVEAHDLNRTVDVYERLYNGLTVAETTLDNDPEYLAPVAVMQRFTRMVRRGSRSIERGTSGVLERLDGVRGSVAESFSDVRFSIERRGQKARKKLSTSFRKVIERIRRDD